MSKSLRRSSLLVVAAAMLAGAFVITPSIVTPEKAPQAEAHGGVTNGCSGPAPEAGAGWNFHDECDWHDLCYHYHWYGEGETGRYWCDVYFSNLMGRECAQIPWWNANRWNCTLVNEIFYQAVRRFGSDYFYRRVPDVPLPYHA